MLGDSWVDDPAYGLGRLPEAKAAINEALRLLDKESFRHEFEAHAKDIEAARASKKS
jgi:hypothetical protein